MSYDRLKVWDATGRELASEMKARGQRVSIEVRDLEAEYPLTIDPVFEPVTKLTASDGEAGDRFGFSVSISGDTIVVGANRDDSFRGSAYVFERNQGGADLWGEVKKLTASDGAANDFFGFSVSISGDTIVAGALDDDSSRGAAYVFKRNQGGGDNWSEVTKLTASDGLAGDRFGTSVSISGDTIVVGANGDDSLRGSAYVFERNQGGADLWGQVKKLTASDGAAGDVFGFSVSISGHTIIVGAIVDDSQRGSSYIFTINCPPMISTMPVSVERSATNSGATIATVSDDLTPASDLIVTVESAPASITLINIINTDGAISADVSADCSASIGANTVTLSVMDQHGLVTMADLTVNVSAETTPPVINCPANITTGTDKGQCSAAVNFTATATDNCDGSLTPVCTPPSGSSFPVGTTTVMCEATDAAGNSAQCSFTVTVNDTEAPDLTCPAPITVGNDKNLCSAVVGFTATANDSCDGAITPVCTPPSGSIFPIGATSVNCTATDAAGNTANRSFTVTVNDTEAPAINCPLPITRNNDPGVCGAAVAFTITASDNCSGVGVVCAPASSSIFPVGATTVNCTATDSAGNSSDCSFTVTVNDTENPSITCPANITVTTPGVGNPTRIVNYSPPAAADNCSVASLVCNPPSGSAFPLGTTTVTCTATDTSGNSAQCSFTVSVFDVCIEDDNDPSKSLLFISTGPLAGTYRICCGGQTLTGKGTVGLKSGILSLTHFTSERRVQGFLYMNQQRGSAALQSPPSAFPCAITDSNTSNNTCSCSANP